MFEHQHIAFFTATILEWKHLLKVDKYKHLIIDSLKYLVGQEKIFLYGYVIMPNHIHLLWKIKEPFSKSDIQRDFLRFTAQQIRIDLKKNHPEVLNYFKSNRKDRKSQFWEANPMTIYCYSREVVEQKLNYIHQNPVKDKWQLSETPEEYFFSSASFYLLNQSEGYEFLTHYCD